MKARASILLVEDEPAILNLLEVTLKARGFEVRQALDANAARVEVAQALPDLGEG